MNESARETNAVRPAVPTRWVIGTRLALTSYSEFAAVCQRLAGMVGTTSVDFTNTQIVTMRRHDPAFRASTERVDYFVPDGMPLIWCLNMLRAGLKDRVYGPTFMREFIAGEHRVEGTHFFLGGSAECVQRLTEKFIQHNPAVRIVGTCDGYFRAPDEARIVAEINRVAPDFIWVGLGTPKQQEWIERNRDNIARGVIFAVGFGFDVNAGTKPDAPQWMQRLGLTWVFRIASEPRRLLGRYLRYNSLFLWYLFWDGIRGRAFRPVDSENRAAGEPRISG